MESDKKGPKLAQTSQSFHPKNNKSARATDEFKKVNYY